MARWWRHRRTAAAGDERGMVALDTAILASVIILLPALLVQGAMYFTARNTAINAARHGVEATRVATGAEDPGATAAREYVLQVGGPFDLTGVSASRSATEATVTVTGEATSILPMLQFEVSESVTAPVERFEP